VDTRRLEGSRFCPLPYDPHNQHSAPRAAEKVVKQAAPENYPAWRLAPTPLRSVRRYGLELNALKRSREPPV